MGKLIDNIKAAQDAKNPDGTRKFTDDEIYYQFSLSPKGREILNAADNDENRVRQGLGLSPVVEDRTLTHPETAQDPNPVTRLGKMAGGALLEGAGAVVGLPGSAMQLISDHTPANFPTHWDRKFPIKSVGGVTLPDFKFPPSGGEVNEFTKGLGLTDRTDAESQNLLEREAKGALVGLGASVPFTLATGGAGSMLTPEFIAAGLMSGIGEQSANELAPGNPWMGLFGSVVGSMTGQGITKKIMEGMTNSALRDTYLTFKAALDKSDIDSIHIQNAHDAQLKITLDKAGQTLEQTKNMNLAAAQAEQAVPRANIARHATTLAPVAGTWEDAGQAMKAALQKWVENDMPDQLDAIWKPVSDKVPFDASLKLDAFGAALNRIVPSGGAMQGMIETVSPRLAPILKARLAAAVDGQISGVLPEFTWGQARAFRTALGDALRDPKVRGDLGDRNLRQLYAALTSDLKVTANEAGAGDLFDAANKASIEIFNTAENVVAPVLETSPNAVGSMAKRIAGNAATNSVQITNLRKLVPQAVDHLAAVHLSPANMHTWAKLNAGNPTSAKAFIPDPVQLQDINDSIEAIAKANGKGKSLNDLAVDSHNLAVDQAKELRGRLADQQKLTKMQLQQATRDAKEALDARTTKTFQGLTTKSLVQLAGLGGGGALGTVVDAALNASGIHLDKILNQGPGLIAGLGIPAAINGVNELIHHPDLAAGPLMSFATHGSLQRGRQEKAKE